MLDFILTVFAFLTLFYLEIGFILGFASIILNPTGEQKITKRVMLGCLYIICWGIILIAEGELY